MLRVLVWCMVSDYYVESGWCNQYIKPGIVDFGASLRGSEVWKIGKDNGGMTRAVTFEDRV